MNPQYPAQGSSSRHGQQPQQQQVQPAPQPAPAYDISHVGHYGASAAIASTQPVQELYGTHFHNVSHGLQGNYRDILTVYWQQMISSLENEEHDYKIHQLPLARIKKVMKADPEVKMISAEAPILFAKGCDIFITELTMRAWIHAEENKRRTLQRSDIASALAKSDMFDFLIDIVPREEATHSKRSANTPSMPPGPTGTTPQMSSAVPPQQMGGAPPAMGGQGYGHLGGEEAEQGYQPPRQMYGIPGGQPAYQHEMYGGVDPYAYTMHQQPMYQIPGQRHDDGGEDPSHFQRGEGEERDADAEAEAEHDYEVG